MLVGMHASPDDLIFSIGLSANLQCAELQGAWLEHIKECDIMTDWKGSDHAPVWVDVDIPSLAPVSGPLRMESSARFAGEILCRHVSCLTLKEHKFCQADGTSHYLS